MEQNNIIVAEKLNKSFTVPVQKSGVGNAFKQLVHKQQKTVRAVNDVTLIIQKGEFVGFLGPNGAGKTTTLKMLTGILYPTHGSAQVLGYIPHERNYDFLRRISFVSGQKQILMPDLPPLDSYALLKEIYNIPKADYTRRLDEMIAILGLEKILTTQVRRLSLGEKMKSELVAALLHNPEVIFLDEPTIGLDIVSQNNIWHFLHKHNTQNNSTIILTSHYLEDIQRLCKRVIIINSGEKIYDGDLEKLILSAGNYKNIQCIFSKNVEVAQLRHFGTVIKHNDTSATIRIEQPKLKTIIPKIMDQLPINDLSITSPEARDVITLLYKNVSK